jgi:hypothetical protein
VEAMSKIFRGVQKKMQKQADTITVNGKILSGNLFDKEALDYFANTHQGHGPTQPRPFP